MKIENGSYIPQKALKGTGSSEVETGPDVRDLFDTQRVSLNYSKQIGKVDFTASGALVKADNEFVFLDSTNRKRIRENASLVGGNVATGAHITHSSGFLDVNGSALYHERNVPGRLGSETPDANQNDFQGRGNFRYRTEDFFTENLTFDINTHFDYYQIDYFDPKWSVNSTHTTYAVGTDVSQEMLYFNFLTLVYGGSLNYEKMDSTDLGVRERVYTGGFIENVIYLSPTFTLQPVIRYDYYSDFGSSLNYKLGTVYNLSPELSLKGNVSRSFRAPTFNDLYWPRDAFAEGNPDLVPEIGYSADIGLSSVRQKIDYDLFAYLRYVENVIIWQPGEDSIWRPSNFGKGLYPGFEARARVSFLDYYTFSLDYSFLYSFVFSEGYTLLDNKRLPDIPVHSLNMGLNYSRNKASVHIGVQYQGLRYLKIENRAYMPSYFLVNGSYTRSLTNSISFLVSIDNVFGEAYENVNQYPMPGITVRTGIEMIL